MYVHVCFESLSLGTVAIPSSCVQVKQGEPRNTQCTGKHMRPRIADAEPQSKNPVPSNLEAQRLATNSDVSGVSDSRRHVEPEPSGSPASASSTDDFRFVAAVDW